MTFGKDYWDQHWQQRADGAPTAMEQNPPNPYLVNGTTNLTPGTAFDAGCGAGAEAIWLATQGWQVTAVDISRDALAKAIRRESDTGLPQQHVVGAAGSGISGLHVNWLEADLTVWTPDTQYDLVTTHYAHPTIPQLAFYNRISTWVAPGGTLLLVGHLDTPYSEPEHPQHGNRESEQVGPVDHQHSQPENGHGGHDLGGHGQGAHEHGGHQHGGHQHGGHGQGGHAHGGHGHQPPVEASVSLADITAGLDPTRWELVAAGEHVRRIGKAAAPGGRRGELHDVVVQAIRRA